MRKSSKRNQKLEQGNKRGLILDPQNNHQQQHQLLQLQRHHLNQSLDPIRLAEEDDDYPEEYQDHCLGGEELQEQEQQQQGFHLRGYHLQPQHYQQLQHIHGRLDGEALDAQTHTHQIKPSKKRPYFPFVSTPCSSSPPPTATLASSSEQQRVFEYARLWERMKVNQHHQPSSRLGVKATAAAAAAAVGGGEIVQVQGGHIVRSTGRKDRHSKVCTAKGPRDRRVRLAAHTAIQFYDVQDRLGYDRPSKAVDWLIKKAKASIDELAQRLAWNPITTTSSNSASLSANTATNPVKQSQKEENMLHFLYKTETPLLDSSKRPMGVADPDDSGFDFQQQQLNNPTHSSGFLPPSLDSDAISHTIKSFFPTGAATSPHSINFLNYPPDLISKTSNQDQDQDLRLSIQSFQDPILLHQQQPHHNPQSNPSVERALFSCSAPLAFDTTSDAWSEQPQQQRQQAVTGRQYQRTVGWNTGMDTGGTTGGEGAFIFHSSPLPQPSLGQSQFFPQRGPLQSSNSPSLLAWMDQQISAPNHLNHLAASVHNRSSTTGSGFASGGFFHIPGRIQGDEEQDAVSDKPSTGSSASRH